MRLRIVSFVALAAAVVFGCATQVTDNGDPNAPLDGTDAGDDNGDTPDTSRPLPQQDAAPSGHDAAQSNDTGSTDDASMSNDSASMGDTIALPDTSMTPDMGAPDMGTMDTGVVLCQPQNPNFTGKWTPGTPMHQGACTANAIQQIYTDCFGPNGSANACQLDQFTTCYGCVVTDSSTSLWGPVVNDASTNIAWLNVGGCIATLDSSLTSCAQSAENLAQCEDKACAKCTSSNDKLNSCTSAADTTVCSTYNTPTTSCEAMIPSGSAAKQCLQGSDTFEAFYNRLSLLFCGP